MDEKTITEIISDYPYPIAILYRIIAGMDLHEEPRKGLEYILQTGEAMARFLGMIALAELLLFKEQNDIDIPPSIKAEFKKKFRRPSFGIWLGFARDGLACLNKLGAEMVIPDLKELFYEGRKETEFKLALDKLIKLRNAIAHQKVVLDTTDKQRSAAQISLNYLHVALDRLQFFIRVNFGYIKAIEVNKKRRLVAAFHHKGKTLKGDSIAKGINLSSVQSDFKETDAVILQYDATRYLNLYPFYIYDEDSGDAADVFFYNGYDKKRLEYIGIDPGGKFCVEDQEPEMDRDLDEEFELLLSGSGGKQDLSNVRYSRELHSEFAYIETLFG